MCHNHAARLRQMSARRRSVASTVTLIGLLALGLAGEPAMAGPTIHVPGDYATIQEAINASYNGVEIVVAPDTYHETISFGGRQITLRSSDGPATTIIDAQNNDRAVYFNSGEQRGSVLEGFTITGGGAYIAWCRPTIRGCVFSGNTRDDGPAIRIESASPLIADCTFDGNTAQYDNAGAVQIWGQGGEPVIRGCTFSNNATAAASGRGGAVYVADPGMACLLEDCTFTDNTARFDGGALYFGNHNESVVRACVFERNDANWGGAIIVTSQSATLIEGCSFTDNTSTQYGGAIVINGASVIIVQDGAFVGNASNIGGAIHASNAGTGLTIEGCLFDGNTAGWESGAVHVAGDIDASISDSVFTGNSAPQTAGAIRVRDGADLDMLEVTFSGNVARTGGAIQVCCDSTTEIDRGTFTENFAEYGGAIDCDGDTARLALLDSYLARNGANWGGAVRLQYTLLPLIRHCVFEHNEARWGGAVGSNHSTDVHIEGCLVTHNSAWDRGGGFLMEATTGDTYITNTTIAHNLSTNNDGVGINSTNASTLAITNSILWGNARQSGVLTQIGGNAAVTVSSCDVQGGYGGTDIIDEDPFFADPAGGDYRLMSGSPCIDTGSNALVPAGLTVDLDGHARILDGDADASDDVDMGAHEAADCNGNGIPDFEDIDTGYSSDVNGNGEADDCDEVFAYNVDRDLLYSSLTEAMDDAESGEHIYASPAAFHMDDLDFAGKPLRLESAGRIAQPAGGTIELADESLIETHPDQRFVSDGSLRTAAGSGAMIRADEFWLNEPGALAARSGSTLTIDAPGGSLLFGSLHVAGNAAVAFSGPLCLWEPGPVTVMPGGSLVVGGMLSHAASMTMFDAAVLTGPVETQGSMQLAGVEWVADGFDVQYGAHVIAHGEFYTDMLNESEIDLTGDTLIVGDLANEVTGIITIHAGTTTLVGTLTNDGAIVGDLQTSRETAGPRAYGDGLVIQGGYHAGADSSLTMPHEAWSVSVRGDFDCAITNSSRFDMKDAALILVGVMQTQHVEVMSTDLGADPRGFERGQPGLFPIGTLRVGPTPAVAALVDDHDNDGQGQSAGEAVYVHHLIIEPGATLLTGDHPVYYAALTLLGGVDNIDHLVPVALYRGDINEDGRIDLADHGGLHDCLTGPEGGIAASCAPANLDTDSDVDLADFARFQNNFTN